MAGRAVIRCRHRGHRLKGPGLIESIYEKCLMRELSLRSLARANQRLVKIEYKGLGLRSRCGLTFWLKTACCSN